jgi:hypothetical protein
MKKLILVVLSLLVFATSAFAVPSNPQGWKEYGVGLFDKIEMFMLSDNDFSANNGINTTGTDWQVNIESPDYLMFSGTPLDYIEFYTGFANAAAPIKMNFLAYRGNTLLEAAKIEWVSNDWLITGLLTTSDDLSLYQEMRDEAAAPVPEPSTFMLAGLGIGALFLVRRKQSGFRQGSLA